MTADIAFPRARLCRPVGLEEWRQASFNAGDDGRLHHQMHNRFGWPFLFSQHEKDRCLSLAGQRNCKSVYAPPALDLTRFSLPPLHDARYTEKNRPQGSPPLIPRIQSVVVVAFHSRIRPDRFGRVKDSCWYDCGAAGLLTETRHFYYTSAWQVLEERVDSSASPTRQFVWGLRYIDDCVLRDRDTSGSGMLDERLYALQDGNWNVTSVTNEWTGDREEWFLLHTGTPYVQPLLLKQYMFDPPRKRTRRSDQEKIPEPTRCTKGRMLLEWEIRVFFPDRNNPGLTDREFQMGKEPASAGYGPNTWQNFHSAWWSTRAPQAWKHEPDFTDTISVELKWDMCGTRMKFDVQGSTGTLRSLARPMDGANRTKDAVMHRKEYKPSPTASLWIPQNGRWCLKGRP